MQTHPPTTQPASAGAPGEVNGRLKTAVLLAELMQRVEARALTIGAEQYRRLALHLGSLLLALDEQPALAEALKALLDTFPAAATVYENQRYAQAGLCRHPLESSLASELKARELIARARLTTPAGR